MSFLTRGVQLINELLNLYYNRSMIWIMFIMVLFLLLILNKNELVKDSFIYPSLIVLLIALNPVLMPVAVRFVSVYRLTRIFWLLPVVSVFAYAIVVFYRKKKTIQARVVFLIMALVLTILSGRFMFGDKNFEWVHNIYNIPDETIEICDFIEESGNEGKLFSSIDLVDSIRQYDPAILLSYGRQSESYEGTYGDLVFYDEICLADVCAAMDETQSVYFLLDKDKELDSDIRQYPFVYLYETEGHILYRYQTD